MKKVAKILYIHPFEFYGPPSFLINFIRISNYLNSRKNELEGSLKEVYLDLQFENLPDYYPENIEVYRKQLKKLLRKIFKKIKFNILAITCFSSYHYLNSLEVAFLFKNEINPNCIIILGGAHPSMRPEDFQPGNIPKYFYDEYPQDTTPFDFIVKEEGEVPFFNLISGYLKGILHPRVNGTDLCKIIQPTILTDLNQLPILDLTLFKRYKKVFKDSKMMSIDFTRGCIFRCKFCSNSENYMNCYKTVRNKSIHRCIEELLVIKNTKWLSIDTVFISDMIFLPKRSLRTKFFQELKEIIKENGVLPFKINVMDRIELCSDEDLENYSEFNILPHFGLESCSKTMLYKMGKILGKNDLHKHQGIERYLGNFERIIEKSNELNLPIVYYYMIGTPGSETKVINEIDAFFFDKRLNGESLVEKYQVNFQLSKFANLFGSWMFNNAETEYGTKFYKRDWWKIFDKNQAFYAALVDPSRDFTLKDCIVSNLTIFKKVFKIQSKKGNRYYNLPRFLTFQKKIELILNLYEEIA